MDRATNEWKDGDSLFLSCNVWRQAAENVAESLERGIARDRAGPPAAAVV
jgi:single-strand DNA-binding protein